MIRNYSRQTMFDQEKLGNVKITIIGAGPLTNYLCTYLSGLGIKKINLIDDSSSQNIPNEFLIKGFKGPKVNGLEEKMKEMNPEVSITAVNSQVLEFLIGQPDVLIELTNNPESKNKCKEISKKIKSIKKVISASSSENNASIRMYNPQNDGPIILKKTEPKIFGLGKDGFSLDCYKGLPQGNFTSGLIAAIVLDETRKAVMPLENDHPLKIKTDFSIYSEKRFNSGLNFNEQKDNLSNLKTLVVGAGGIGTYVCLNLALMGVGSIDLYDGDIVEDHNLNRQVFYYNSVGKKKAEVLAERLNRLTKPYIKPHPQYLKDVSNLKKYDIIFSCLDNWQYRFMLSDYAIKNHIPMINGSVTAFNAYAEFYNCLNCKYDREKKLEDEKNQPRGSGGCSSVASSNVVMTNAFVGAMMASETKALAFPDSYKPLYKKQFAYNSQSADDLKFSLDNQDLSCLCNKKTKGCECHENRIILPAQRRRI